MMPRGRPPERDAASAPNMRGPDRHPPADQSGEHRPWIRGPAESEPIAGDGEGDRVGGTPVRQSLRCTWRYSSKRVESATIPPAVSAAGRWVE